MNMVCKISRLATKFKNICIELLQRITPTTDEIKLFREYAASKKDPEKLTEEDRYILSKKSCSIFIALLFCKKNQ